MTDYLQPVVAFIHPDGYVCSSCSCRTCSPDLPYHCNCGMDETGEFVD